MLLWSYAVLNEAKELLIKNFGASTVLASSKFNFNLAKEWFIKQISNKVMASPEVTVFITCVGYVNSFGFVSYSDGRVRRIHRTGELHGVQWDRHLTNT